MVFTYLLTYFNTSRIDRFVKSDELLGFLTAPDACLFLSAMHFWGVLLKDSHSKASNIVWPTMNADELYVRDF